MASIYASVSRAPSFYDILIIGKTGMGKSTLGNMIGILKSFLTGSGTDSVTKECQLQTNDNGTRVLDCPGFADSDDVKQHGVLESNLQIFRWIIRAQEVNNLEFSRVLYFLPTRGPPERADGVLQEEIRAMHEYFGDDIFDVMVLITTSHQRHQHDFEEEDYHQTSEVFMKAYKKMIEKSLRKCPPILYLPKKNEDNNTLLREIVKAEVIDDEQRLKPKGKAAKRVYEHRKIVMSAKFTMDENASMSMASMSMDDLISYAKQKTPGKKLQFQDRCIRCSSKINYMSMSHEAPKTPVTIVNRHNEVLPYEESKCHPIYITKHTDMSKLVGGMAHLATGGIFAVAGAIRGKPIWPGFLNSDEICPKCGYSPGSEGCSVVGDIVYVPIRKGSEKVQVKVSHSTKLDHIPN